MLAVSSKYFTSIIISFPSAHFNCIFLKVEKYSAFFKQLQAALIRA